MRIRELFEQYDAIDALIERAGFSESEREDGTQGFCAMFALALYRAVLKLKPILILVGAKRNGKVIKTDQDIALARDGNIWWCHAALKVNGAYYDIYGRAQPQEMFDNYAWSIDTGKNLTPCIIELSPRDFIDQIRTTHSARDWRFYVKCKNKLAATIEAEPVPLGESVFDEIQSAYSPEKTYLYVNPSRREFEQCFTRLKTHAEIDPAGTMRGILDPKTLDVYIWDGYHATHGSLMDRYGMRGFHLILERDKIKVLTMWRYERLGFDEKQVRDLVENDPCLRNCYRGIPIVEIQP